MFVFRIIANIVCGYTKYFVNTRHNEIGIFDLLNQYIFRKCPTNTVLDIKRSSIFPRIKDFLQHSCRLNLHVICKLHYVSVFSKHINILRNLY